MTGVLAFVAEFELILPVKIIEDDFQKSDTVCAVAPAEETPAATRLFHGGRPETYAGVIEERL